MTFSPVTRRNRSLHVEQKINSSDVCFLVPIPFLLAFPGDSAGLLELAILLFFCWITLATMPRVFGSGDDVDGDCGGQGE